MSEERITYDEFMTMFKFAPRMCYTLYDKAEKEIDKLNNIINELEKWLKKEHENGYEVYYLMAIQDILDKLKELKENNK